MAKRAHIARRNIEQQPLRDDYQELFLIGQIAARLAEKAKDPSGTFRRIVNLGVAAEKENMPRVIRVLPWVK